MRGVVTDNPGLQVKRVASATHAGKFTLRLDEKISSFFYF